MKWDVVEGQRSSETVSWSYNISTELSWPTQTWSRHQNAVNTTWGSQFVHMPSCESGGCSHVAV